MPEEVRERLDIPFSAAERRQFEQHDALIRTSFPHLPDRVKYFKRAYQARQAAEQQAIASEALATG
jgi:uncharacterized protein (DUF2236 family)